MVQEAVQSFAECSVLGHKGLRIVDVYVLVEQENDMFPVFNNRF
jgi:hypothetical protein